MPEGKMVETTVWLMVDPTWPRGASDVPVGMTVASVLKNKPKRISGVAVKLRLRIPAQAFLPLRPEVTIDVPEGALEYEPEVTVEFPE